MLLQARQSDASLSMSGLSSPPMPDLSAVEGVLSLATSASHLRDDKNYEEGSLRLALFHSGAHLGSHHGWLLAAMH